MKNPRGVHQSHPEYQERKAFRARVGKTAAALGLVSLAAWGIATWHGSDNGPEYSPQTEVGLEKAIKPAMATMAKDAIRLAAQNPGSFEISSVGNDLVKLVGDGGTIGSELGNVQVVMQAKPGSSNPDPQHVLFASAETAGTAGADGSSFSGEGVQFIAPGGEKFADNNSMLVAASSEGGNWRGWSGQTFSSLKLGNTGQPYFRDTTQEADFSLDGNGNPTNPETTAREIAQNVPDVLESVDTTFTTH